MTPDLMLIFNANSSYNDLRLAGYDDPRLPGYDDPRLAGYDDPRLAGYDDPRLAAIMTSVKLWLPKVIDTVQNSPNYCPHLDT